MTDTSGPGMVPLEPFLTARLDAPGTATIDPVITAAHRRILDAYRAAKYGTMHRAGLEVAVKALAGIWADHDDYDPTWRF